MRQITSAVRCLSLALVLVAAFASLSPAEQASARYSRADLEYVCVAQGGIYWESPAGGINGIPSYGCWYPEGDEDTCYDVAPQPICVYYPAEPHIGDPLPGSSHPADGQLADQNSDAPSAPADSYRSGYESKMAER